MTWQWVALILGLLAFIAVLTDIDARKQIAITDRDIAVTEFAEPEDLPDLLTLLHNER